MSRWSYMSNRQSMRGDFIKAPDAAREYCGYEWRTSSATYKRDKKRALSKFRRNDGKRFLMEGLAKEQERIIEVERYPWWKEQGEDDECARCGPETCYCYYWDDLIDDPYYDYYEWESDPAIHDDGAGPVDWSEYIEAMRPSNEDLYQEAQQYDDWAWEVEREYRDRQGRERAFKNGYEEGYRQAKADFEAVQRYLSTAS